MILAFSLLGLFYLLGLGVLLKSWHSAPEGFQDENRFRYGTVDAPAQPPTNAEDDGFETLPAISESPDTHEQLHAW